MAIIGQKESRRKFKRRLIAAIVILILGLLAMPYVTFAMDEFLRSRGSMTEKITYLKGVHGLLKNNLQQQLAKYYIIMVLIIEFIYLTNNSNKHNTSEIIQLTEDIAIPKPAGEGQFGTARFATQKEVEKKLTKVIYKKDKVISYKDAKKLGLIVHMEKIGHKEIYYCMNEDGHILIIGGTRSGKTRGLIYQLIWLKTKEVVKKKSLIQKIFKIKLHKKERGRSFIATDVKGELSAFTGKPLKDNGFNVIELNFREPLKSIRYNFMVYINEAVDRGDIATAIDKTWDLVSQLVGIPKGEPLWTNGQACVLAASTLTVSMDSGKEEFRNLPNVYHFIGVMCREDDYGKLLFENYLAEKDSSHPAKEIFYTAEVAPGKTRASFFTSALSTLNLFTNWNVADMTSRSEFTIDEMVDKPTALFIIIPDEKETLNKLVTLFIQQTYLRCIEISTKRGGRLPILDIILEEFGNLPGLVGIGPMMSAGAGRGVRLTLVIQDYEQLKKNYKDEIGNIKGNCETIFLRSGNDDTVEAISKKLDTYTVKVGTSNVSNTTSFFKGDTNYSNGENLTSRRLLFPNEVNMINRPYSIFMPTGYHPSILKIPDLSEYRANKELGMGSEEFNEKLFMERDNERPIRESNPPKYWNVLNESKGIKKESIKEKVEEINFLNPFQVRKEEK